MSRRKAASPSPSGGGGGSGAAAVGAAAPLKPATVLEERYLGLFPMKLSNLQTTTIARQTNSVGVQGLVESFKQNGYMDSGAISVIVMGVEQGADFTRERALDEPGQVLDGNHRVKAALQCFPKDKLIPCRCYRDIENKHVKKIVADACNSTTESFQKRTVYDMVYWFLTYLQDFRQASRPGKSITIRDMKAPYAAAGLPPPSDSSLRKWKLAVEGLSDEALQALKALAESSDPTVKLKVVTLTFLSRRDFIGLKTDKPYEQALWIQTLARFQHSAKKQPEETDIKQIGINVARVSQWTGDLATIIPRDEWSAALKDEVDRQAFENPKQYEFLQKHFQQLDAEIKHLEQDLPAHNDKLEPWIKNTVRAQQFGRVKTIIMDDSNTRPMYDTFLKKYQEARNEVARRKLQIAPPVSSGKGKGKGKDSGENDDRSGSSNDDSEDEDAEGGKGGKRDAGGGDECVLCSICKPPKSSGYHCVDCNVLHVRDGCSNSNVAVEGQSVSDNARRCIDCKLSSSQSSGRTLRPKRVASGAVDGKDGGREEGGSRGGGASGTRKKSKSSRGTAPSTTPAIPSEADSDQVMKLACRAAYTKMHGKCFLSPKTEACELMDHFTLKEPAKLIFLSIAGEKGLMSDSGRTNDRLRLILKAVAQGSCLHAEGTVVLAVPVPVHVHAYRLNASLVDPGAALAVEDHGLYVEYSSRGGGRLATGTEDYLRGGVGHFMIAHSTTTTTTGNTGGKAFTCNRKVTVNDIAGSGSSIASTRTATTSAESLMRGVAFPGAGTDFPDRVVNFFIQRFTKRGDTVMTCSGERDRVAEIALSIGRKVEVSVADMETHSEVSDRLEAAFEAPYREGYLERDASASQGMAYIGPGKLPSSLPSDTMPVGVRQQVESAKLDEPDLTDAEVAQKVNRDVAHQMGWALKGGDVDDESPVLHAIQGAAYDINQHDIPLWGSLIICESLPEAKRSIPGVAGGHQYVRLVLLADNNQLKGMMDQGKEVLLHPQASLYLRVAETCPAYYAIWESTRENTHHEVVNSLPRSVDRRKLLDAWKDANNNVSAPLKLRVFRAITRAGEVLMVHQGTSGICAQEGEMMSDDGEDAGSSGEQEALGVGDDMGSAEDDADCVQA